MKLHDALPRAGWTILAFVGLGAGTAIGFVSQAPVPPRSAETVKAQLATAHCVVADIPPQALSAEAMKAYDDSAPPLWNDLGSLTYPISTKSTEAQSYFDQGLQLAANFNHAEARRAFRKAQAPGSDLCDVLCSARRSCSGRTSTCRWTPKRTPRRSRRFERRKALSAGASEKEKGLIEAVATRYVEDPTAERPPLDAAFADATAALSDKYPDDLELAVLAAEAAMDTQPWDYWQPGGKEPKGRTAMCRSAWKASWQRNPTMLGRSISTSIWWRPPIGPSAPNPTPIGLPH